MCTSECPSAGAERCVSNQLETCSLLVNNAGGAFGFGPIAAANDDDWQRMWEKNVMGGARLSRHYMRGMLARNWGRVIFISSEAALNPTSDALHYGVTKTAVLGLSRGLADLTVGTAVTVNAVLPGPTRTEETVAWMTGVAKEKGISIAEAEKNYFETVRPASIIRRFAEPSEVASLVAYVASPLSAVTNGESLRVEGGIVHSIG